MEDGPFTVAEGLARGISPGVLRGDRYRRVLVTVCIAADVAITARVRAEAALLLAPRGVLSHHTALELWGAAGPVSDDVHVSVQRDQHQVVPRVSGLRVHEVRDLDPVTVAGLPVTPPERTFLDVAACCALTELVTAGDSWYAVLASAQSPCWTRHRRRSAYAESGSPGRQLGWSAAASTPRWSRGSGC